MALIRLIADGTEPPCHKCHRPINEGTMKVSRPSLKPIGTGSHSVGGKSMVWVHDACSPTKHKKHGTGTR
jgi:hypothetical protein